MRYHPLFILLGAVVVIPTACLVAVCPLPWNRVALAGILLELIILAVVYRRLFRPIKVIAGGMDLLCEQDFSSLLKHVGQSDADKIVDMFNAMMERLRSQSLRMREQHSFLQLLIEASPMAVMILNDDNTVTDANEASRTMLACDPVGSKLSDIGSPLGRAIASLGEDELRTVRIGGREIYRCSRLSFMDRGWKHPFILVESLTEEVRNAEKIALTRVIRTMAHEVNNSMAGILTTIDTATGILSATPAATAIITPLQACSERANALTGFVRRFAEVVKIPEPNRILTDFQELVEPVAYFLESLCSRCGATLSIDVERSAPLRFDPVLMQQVLINIVKNAAESASQGGKVAIVADGATLTVEDDGPGISAEDEAHLFTALYTTKPDGQGLGLMLVGEILSRHNADFSLRTIAPRRTVFTVAFRSL